MQAVDYVTHSGSDLLVANAARVSFAKHKDQLGEDDERLISYLAKHNHWTPFGHPHITLRVKTPIFVARQLFKHKIGMVENEVSRRYVDDDPEFFFPEKWRGKPTNGAKQGSSDETVSTNEYGHDLDLIYSSLLQYAENCYTDFIDSGVAPEQARMVLPQSMYTEWYWTGSLSAYARIYKLRIDPHAQRETQEVVKMIGEIIEPLFPVSWKVLTSAPKEET